MLYGEDNHIASQPTPSSLHFLTALVGYTINVRIRNTFLSSNRDAMLSLSDCSMVSRGKESPSPDLKRINRHQYSCNAWFESIQSTNLEGDSQDTALY